jgi:trans-aconitate methyltransferase
LWNRLNANLIISLGNRCQRITAVEKVNLKDIAYNHLKGLKLPGARNLMSGVFLNNEYVHDNIKIFVFALFSGTINDGAHGRKGQLQAVMKQKNKYTWNAADYAKHSSAQQDWARELIAKLNLNGDESVLDIGCGEGKVTAEIAGNLPAGHVLGVDSSNDMIESAGTHFPTDTYSNLSFQLADARKLPFKEQFDIVFSNAALHWIIDHQPVLSGIHNSLKSKGRVLLQMGGKGNAESVISVLESIIAHKEWISYFSDFEFPYGFHDPETYAQWLGKASLNPLRIELIPKDMSFENKDGLSGWIRTTWLPYTNRVPGDLKTELIGQLVDAYVEKYPADSGENIHVQMVRLEVEAIKNG